MKKGILYILSILFIYSLSGCSSHEEEHNMVEHDPVQVKLMKLEASNTKDVFTVSGTIKPIKEANISTRMMGYIERVNVEVGSRVSAGQLLVQVSNTDLEAKLAQVKANIYKAEVGVENAKKDFERISALREKNSVTQKELDDITAHYNMAQAGLEAARQMEKEVLAQFKYTKITAPFSGIVTGKYAQSGDMANPGMPLLTIASSSGYEAVAMVPENKITQVSNGQDVQVWIKSLEQAIPAKVKEVAVSSQNTGGQYIVKAQLNEQPETLHAGMFITVQFDQEQTGQSENQTLLIPTSSLVEKGSLKGVYAVSSENKAILRWLRLGKTYGDQIEVLSGLTLNESIVVEADSRLFNGAPVISK